MSTIGKATSRVRNTIKAVKEDTFVTDRFLYSLIMKYGKTLMKREDDRNKLKRMSGLFTPLKCVELVEVDKVEACCIGLTTGCIIKRTKHKLPDPVEGLHGPMFRTVASLDYSTEIYKTDPESYVSMTKTTNFKYNKFKYFWYLDGYMYFPNIDWEAVIIEGIFEGDTSNFNCGTDAGSCTPRQEQKFSVPEYLMTEIEEMIKKDFGIGAQLLTDGPDDKQNQLR